MALHIMDPMIWALDPGHPSSVSASSTLSNLYSAPHAEMITYQFPERAPKGNVKMPALKVVWYDGGLLPPRPEELADGEMMGDSNGGIIFIGTKADHDRMLRHEPHAAAEKRHAILQTARPVLRRVPGFTGNVWDTDAHERDWITPAGRSDNRVELPRTSSSRARSPKW